MELDMSNRLTGGCLCGKVKYDTGSDPLWVTICYCKFCQRATGSDRMIEPIFEHDPFIFIGGVPALYTLKSDGSGKDVNIHFCSQCGTKLALTFERWPDRLGIYVGTLDDPTAGRVGRPHFSTAKLSITPAGSNGMYRLLPPAG
jgi:hypothetical protein